MKKEKMKVTFSEDTMDYEHKRITNQEVKKIPNYSRMERDIFCYLSEEKYKIINLYLSSYSPTEIDNFYRLKGRSMFSFAITIWATTGPLSFLLNNVPIGAIKAVLSEDNFSLLDCFLGSRSMSEREGWFNQKRIDLVREKLKLIIEFNDDQTNNALENIVSKSYITENVKKCFDDAKLEIKYKI